MLVCGAVYGSTYLRALRYLPSKMELVGVLGRGGGHSQQQAVQFGVPCYTSLEQALREAQVDLACVAVGGGAGVAMAEALLRQGIPVIQEHPLTAVEVRKMQGLARAHKTVWHLNSHFGDLPQVSPFIIGCQRLVANSQPLFINITTNPRTLYSTLDILARALPAFAKRRWVRIPLIDERVDFFATISGQLSGAVALIQNQRTVSAVDDGSATLVSHHLQVGFPEGVIELGDTFGPVVWRPNPAHSFSGKTASAGGGKLWDIFPQPLSPSSQDIQAQRDQANAVALERLLLQATTGRVIPEQEPLHQSVVSEVWDELITLFGPPIQLSSS